jgi:hypothetical protein
LLPPPFLPRPHPPVPSLRAPPCAAQRLVITRHLINAFRAVIATTPADLLPAVYLCTNRVAPAHDGVELGIGDATLIKALAQATGRKEEAIRAEYGESGDLGLVAARSRAAQKQMFPSPPLTVQTVGVAGVCSFSGFLCFFCGCVGGVEGRGRGL